MMSTDLELQKLLRHDVSVWNPGQTESQVDASSKLGSTCYSTLPGLACTCVDLRWLALTLVEIAFARNFQVKATFSPFGHPTQANAQIPNTSPSARSRSRSPPSLARAFSHHKILQTPSPIRSFPCAYEVAQSPHGNNMLGANTRSVLARFYDNKLKEGERFCKNLLRQRNICGRGRGARACALWCV